MKIKFKNVALFTVLSLMAVGCQKETIVEPVDAQIQQATEIRHVTYTIDGVTMYTTIRGEQNWRDFIDWITRLAEEGHSVSFRNENTYSNSQHSKDTVVFTTKDRDKAIAWSIEMTEQGYEVSVTYNETTGIYTCTATN